MYSADHLERVASHLKKLAAQIMDVAGQLAGSRVQQIEIGHFSEMTRGLAALEKFSTEASLSFLRASRTESFGAVTAGDESAQPSTDTIGLRTHESAERKKRGKRPKSTG